MQWSVVHGIEERFYSAESGKTWKYFPDEV